MASLASLPSELLDSVSDSLEPSDIFSLRLMSHHICDSVDDKFTKLFFTERKHLDTVHSLDTLVKISEHPQLRKHLRSLEIYTISPYVQDFEFLLDSKSSSRPLSEEAWLGGVDRQWLYISSKGVECNSDHPCLQLLTKASTNLLDAGVVPKLGVYNYPEAWGPDLYLTEIASNRPYGLGKTRRALERYCSGQKRVSLASTRNEAVMLACALVTGTHYPAKSLHFAGSKESLLESQQRRSSVGNCALLTQLLDTQPDIFANITCLTTMPVSIGPFGDIEFLLRWLACMPKLRALTLSLAYAYASTNHSDDFALLVTWLASRDLTSFGISGGNLGTELLVQLLSPLAASIRHLSIWWVKLCGEDCWNGIFRLLANGFQLESASFGWLKRYVDRQAYYACAGSQLRAPPNSVYDAVFRFEGDEAVRVGLEDLTRCGYCVPTQARSWVQSREVQ